MKQENVAYYIYEGYFNNTESSSDEIVNDIEQDVLSQTLSQSKNVFSTCYDLYIVPSKLEDVLRNINFNSYFYNINRIYESMSIFDADNDMYILIEDPDKKQYVMTLSDASRNLLDKLIQICSDLEQKYPRTPDRNPGFSITISLCVGCSITKNPSFDRFIKEIKRLISAVYPLYNVFSSVGSRLLDYNRIYFSWSIDGKDNEYGKNTAFTMIDWRYKGYQMFYNKLYNTNETFFSNDSNDETYKKGCKRVNGSYSINSLFRICHRLQFSDINEQQYGYRLEGYYDFGENSHKDIYIELMPMTDADNVLSKMVEWIKTNIIERLSYADKISLIGKAVSSTIEIYVAVMTKDNKKPKFDLNKSGKADSVSGNQSVNEQQYISYTITFLDGMFSRFNQKRKAIMSKHYENACQYHYQYRDDLKDGVFGRNQHELSYTYFTELSNKMDSQKK